MSIKCFYAVKVGRKKGIYRTWEECRPLVDGFSNAEFQGFATEKKAIEYLTGHKEKVAENKELFFVDCDLANAHGANRRNR